MNKRINFLKGAFRTLLSSTLIIAVLFAMSCDSGDDPEPELYEFPGVYTFTEAILQTKISFMLGIIPVSIPAGKDITEDLVGGLLAEAPCDDENNGAIELRSNNELYFTCIGETNELKAGTWEYTESEKLLNLNIASPPLPAPIPLKIQDIVIDAEAEIVSGTIEGFPLTPSLMLGFLPSDLTDGKTQEQLDALMALFPAVVQVDVSIKFQKVSE